MIRDERLFYIQRENVSVRDERRPYKTRSWEILFFTRGNSRNSKRSHLYTHAFLSLFPSLLTSLSRKKKKSFSFDCFFYLSAPPQVRLCNCQVQVLHFLLYTTIEVFFFEGGKREWITKPKKKFRIKRQRESPEREKGVLCGFWSGCVSVGPYLVRYFSVVSLMYTARSSHLPPFPPFTRYYHKWEPLH